MSTSFESSKALTYSCIFFLVFKPRDSKPGWKYTKKKVGNTQNMRVTMLNEKKNFPSQKFVSYFSIENPDDSNIHSNLKPLPMATTIDSAFHLLVEHFILKNEKKTPLFN